MYYILYSCSKVSCTKENGIQKIIRKRKCTYGTRLCLSRMIHTLADLCGSRPCHPRLIWICWPGHVGLRKHCSMEAASIWFLLFSWSFLVSKYLLCLSPSCQKDQ